MSVFRRIPLRIKLLVVMVVPMVGASVFATGTVSSRLAEAGQAETVELLAELSVHAGDLLHETQKERGSTALYLSSGGTQFVDELPAQQATTDGPRFELIDFVDANAADLPDEVLGGLQPALDALGEIEGRRERAIALDGELPEFIGWYTAMNADLLTSIALMATESPDERVAIDSAAYVSFLNAKERAGLERAQLSAAFATDRFAPGQLATVVSLVSAQTSFLDLFEALAAPEVLAFHVERQSAPAVEETVRLERLAIDNGVGGFGVDPTVWFDTITQRINLLKEVEDFQAARITATSATIAADARRAATGSIVVGVLVLLVTVAVGGATVWALATDIGSISRSATRIADGELSLEPLEVGTRDELGRLRESFNQMTASLNLMVDGLRQSSDSLNNSSNELIGLFEQVSETATESAEIVGSAADASGRLAQTMSSVSSSVEEMNATISEIAGSAQRASAGTGRAVDRVEQTMKTIGDLGESSEQIGAVIDMINDIAEQTNLLALNATIEAARAGDEGKGFAVVANEVKMLAAKTSDATTEITERIQVIQEEVGRAVTGNDEVAEIISEINDVSGTIAAAVEEQSVSMAEISKSIDNTAIATTQISESIEQVAAGAQQSRQASETSRETADRMGTLAADLDELVSTYR